MSPVGSYYYRSSVNTFNKIWITPDKAVVYEHDNFAMVSEATLKTMLEEDYLALKNNVSSIQKQKNMKEGLINQVNAASSKVMRETILPKINADVNSGKNFATLRQIYYSLILGVWFKKKFKDSLYKAYINQGNVKGIDLADKGAKDKIYNLYVEAFKKGIYNYIKPEKDLGTGRNIKRQYFSGGFTALGVSSSAIINKAGSNEEVIGASKVSGSAKDIEIRLSNPSGAESTGQSASPASTISYNGKVYEAGGLIYIPIPDSVLKNKEELIINEFKKPLMRIYFEGDNIKVDYLKEDKSKFSEDTQRHIFAYDIVANKPALIIIYDASAAGRHQLKISLDKQRNRHFKMFQQERHITQADVPAAASPVEEKAGYKYSHAVRNSKTVFIQEWTTLFGLGKGDYLTLKNMPGYITNNRISFERTDDGTYILSMGSDLESKGHVYFRDSQGKLVEKKHFNFEDKELGSHHEIAGNISLLIAKEKLTLKIKNSDNSITQDSEEITAEEFKNIADDFKIRCEDQNSFSILAPKTVKEFVDKMLKKHIKENYATISLSNLANVTFSVSSSSPIGAEKPTAASPVTLEKEEFLKEKAIGLLGEAYGKAVRAKDKEAQDSLWYQKGQLEKESEFYFISDLGLLSNLDPHARSFLRESYKETQAKGTSGSASPVLSEVGGQKTEVRENNLSSDFRYPSSGSSAASPVEESPSDTFSLRQHIDRLGAVDGFLRFLRNNWELFLFEKGFYGAIGPEGSLRITLFPNLVAGGTLVALGAMTALPQEVLAVGQLDMELKRLSTLAEMSTKKSLIAMWQYKYTNASVLRNSDNIFDTELIFLLREKLNFASTGDPTTIIALSGIYQSARKVFNSNSFFRLTTSDFEKLSWLSGRLHDLDIVGLGLEAQQESGKTTNAVEALGILVTEFNNRSARAVLEALDVKYFIARDDWRSLAVLAKIGSVDAVRALISMVQKTKNVDIYFALRYFSTGDLIGIAVRANRGEQEAAKVLIALLFDYNNSAIFSIVKPEALVLQAERGNLKALRALMEFASLGHNKSASDILAGINVKILGAKAKKGDKEAREILRILTDSYKNKEAESFDKSLPLIKPQVFIIEKSSSPVTNAESEIDPSLRGLNLRTDNSEAGTPYGGIDMQDIKVDAAPGTSPVNLPMIDLKNFQGFTFRIIRIEPITNFNAIFGATFMKVEGKAGKENLQLAYAK